MANLIRWEKAKQAIVEAKTVDEVKDIRDQAEAMRAYAKQRGESQEMQNNIAEIKLRAERRIGEMLREAELKSGRPEKSLHDERIKLQDLGITEIQSHRWQQEAAIPEEDFEQHLASIRSRGEDITSFGLYKKAKELQKQNRISMEETQKNIIDVNCNIRNGDFKTVLSDIYNIDAIITDPPYPIEYINCFSELSLYAKNHVKQDGFIAVYSGQYHLPEAIKRLSENLTYVWTFCLYHSGKMQLVNGVNIMCGWKPVLIFSNGRKKMRFSAYDILISEKMEKELHPWQQSESGVMRLIEILTEPGQLIVDPFAGSGTFIKVAEQLKRNAIGAEDDSAKKR